MEQFGLVNQNNDKLIKTIVLLKLLIVLIHVRAVSLSKRKQIYLPLSLVIALLN